MFKIGEAWKIHFSLRDLGGQLPSSSPGLVIGDCKVRKDDGNFATAQGSLDQDAAVYGHYSYTFHSAEYSPTNVVTFLMQLSGYRDYEITIYPEPSMVDDIWNEVLTGGTHNIANSSGRKLRLIHESGGYESGAVWIDTINGAPGSDLFEHGTVENPVSNITNARILAGLGGFIRFKVANGSSIEFPADVSGETYIGTEWTLTLASANIAGAYIEGAVVSGIATGANYRMINCKLGACTLANGGLRECALTGTLTLSAASTYILDACFSGVAGAGTPVIDFGVGILSTALNMRHYSGGIEIRNMGNAGTDTMSLEGHGQLIVHTNCLGGTIAIRGAFTVTDPGENVTINDDARYDIAQIDAVITANTKIVAILADTATLPSDPASETNVNANETKLDIIAAFLDTEIAAILEDTGATIPNQITALNNLSQANIRTALGMQNDDMDAQLVAITNDTDELQKDDIPGKLTTLTNALAAAHALLATKAEQVTIDGIVDNILLDTGELQQDDIPGKLTAQTNALAVAHALLATKAAQVTIDGIVDNILIDTATTLPDQITALANLGLTDVIEGTLTLQQVLRLLLAALAGKASGGGTANIKFRSTTDSQDRIAAVVDVNGNRTSVTLNTDD